MVPSAKLETFASLMKNIRSFIQRLNKIGPNIDPFETPSKDVQDMNQKLTLVLPVEDRFYGN